jgi:lipopolysaccharide transport system permease protein
MMVMFSFIFSRFLKVPTDGLPYPVFSYTALLPWTFFATSVTFASSSLINNVNLVTKSYFPREILPIAAVLASLIDFSVASVVFVGMMLFYGVPIRPTLALVPLLLVVQTTMTVGIALFTSAVNVFYRDVRFVVPLLLRLWMYATPIIYPLEVVPPRLRSIYLLNPMAGLIESYRAVALRGAYPSWFQLGPAAGVSLAVFVFGYLFFRQVEWRFADVI